MSPAKIRMIGLGAAVTIAVLLPIVAVAGPTGPTGQTGSTGSTGDSVRPAGQGDAKPGNGNGGEDGDLLSGLGLGRGSRTAESSAAGAHAGPDVGAAPAPASVPASVPISPPPSASGPSSEAPERITKCGPELASPEGIEAQTCVLAEGPDTWARTYYRNATGQELDAFLTLMAPGGRTVQVRCPVAAQDEPGTCETPRERGQDKATAYTAVAEFAGTGEGDSTPLLLRSGSNTADTEGS
ncbi:hypothetical protein ACWGQ4_07405 [Streptomyces sp. NPDC055721]|uniref:hypothetical protein n=1 Tax=Streptomyces sp. NPDC127132 TaxID=3345374 RepID=UPI003629E9F2